MKYLLYGAVITFLATAGCASKGYDEGKLEKYPACYHVNKKIYAKCIKKNEAGEKVTAMELENAAYPGQYK